MLPKHSEDLGMLGPLGRNTWSCPLKVSDTILNFFGTDYPSTGALHQILIPHTFMK